MMLATSSAASCPWPSLSASPVRSSEVLVSNHTCWYNLAEPCRLPGQQDRHGAQFTCDSICAGISSKVCQSILHHD